MILEVGPGWATEDSGPGRFFGRKRPLRYKFNPKAKGVYLDIGRPELKIPNFIRGDACYLPFRDNAFEAVYASLLLECLEDPVPFLKEARRVAPRLFLWISGAESASGRFCKASVVRGWLKEAGFRGIKAIRPSGILRKLLSYCHCFCYPFDVMIVADREGEGDGQVKVALEWVCDNAIALAFLTTFAWHLLRSLFFG